MFDEPATGASVLAFQLSASQSSGALDEGRGKGFGLGGSFADEATHSVYSAAHPLGSSSTTHGAVHQFDFVVAHLCLVLEALVYGLSAVPVVRSEVEVVFRVHNT